MQDIIFKKKKKSVEEKKESNLPEADCGAPAKPTAD